MGGIMYQNILVPLDGSELAECVLPHLEAIAKGCGVKNVTFVRVAEPIHSAMSSGDDYYFSGEIYEQLESNSRVSAESYLSNLMSKVNYGGVVVKSEVLGGGRAADIIAEYATKGELDLIIIATHGRSGVSRWVWGSVADRILRSACVPVLMVRAPGCAPGI